MHGFSKKVVEKCPYGRAKLSITVRSDMAEPARRRAKAPNAAAVMIAFDWFRSLLGLLLERSGSQPMTEIVRRSRE
jgi:hypothetical protein